MSPERALAGLPLAVIDTETTGLTEDDRIVEVAIVHVDLREGAIPRVVFAERVRPPFPIPAEATAIHGISDADVENKPPLGRWADRILALTEGRLLVAHSAPFDFRHLAAEEIDLGPFDRRWLDSKILAGHVDRYERSKRLVDVARRRGVVLRDAHGAAADAAALALVVRELLIDLYLGRYTRAVPVLTVGDLLDWQRSAAIAQEQDFADYLARKGATEPPDAPWHDLLGVPLRWDAPPAPAPTWEITEGGILTRLEAP